MERKELPPRYTDLERSELIEQWKQSGKNKAMFCKENSVSYYSFNDWLKRKKRKAERAKSSFVPLKIKNPDSSVFAQLILKNGATVNIYRQVEASYLSALIKS